MSQNSTSTSSTSSTQPPTTLDPTAQTPDFHAFKNSIGTSISNDSTKYSEDSATTSSHNYILSESTDTVFFDPPCEGICHSLECVHCSTCILNEVIRYEAASI